MRDAICKSAQVASLMAMSVRLSFTGRAAPIWADANSRCCRGGAGELFAGVCHLAALTETFRSIMRRPFVVGAGRSGPSPRFESWALMNPWSNKYSPAS